MPLKDENGNTLLFADLIKPANGVYGRRIIVFIRHFYCGNCRDYIRALATEMSPDRLEMYSPGTTLAIIGCGNPDVIPLYRQATNCPFEIYSDPSRRIQKQLGFSTNLFLRYGNKPQYMKRAPGLQLVLDVVTQLFDWNVFQGKIGNITQNGGEFIWVDGNLRFAHRMPSTTGHLEVSELWNALLTRTGMADSSPVSRQTSATPSTSTWTSMSMELDSMPSPAEMAAVKSPMELPAGSFRF